MLKSYLPPAPRSRHDQRVLVANSFILMGAVSFLLLYVPTILTTPVSTWSDGGLFYSVFHQLSEGRRLYAEVFEIKDPLYFYFYAAAYRGFGFPGPMLWETTLSVATLVLLLAITTASRLGSLARAFIISVFTLLFFLPTIYFPLHTFHQSVVFFLLSIGLLLSGRPFWAGCAFGAAVLSKLPMGTFLPAFLWLAMFGIEGTSSRHQALRRGVLALAGCFLMTACVAALLLVRGELTAFVEVIAFNVSYPAAHARSDHDFRLFVPTAGLWERTARLFTEQVVLALIFLIFSNLGLAATMWKQAGGVLTSEVAVSSIHSMRVSVFSLSVFALLVFLGACMLLSVVSLWQHHFQLFGLVFAISLMPSLLWVRGVRSKGALMPWFVIMGTVVAVLVQSGLVQQYWQRETLPNTPPMGSILPGTTSRRFVEQRRRFETQAECLKRTLEPLGTVSFAVVQQNSSGALAALAPRHLRLRCRVFSQWPWFSHELLEEFATCLQDRETSVVLQGPFWARIPEFELRVESTLLRDFERLESCQDTQVWARPGVR